MACSDVIKVVNNINVRTMTEVYEVSGVMYGPLFKWTNYIKGYRYRWFMLQNGYLSYYR
jgi:hypothetical protein